MPIRTLDPTLQELLRGRYIAALGTENADGAIHLTAVWYLFESDSLFVATSSKTQKVRNVAARPKASLMVDSRKSGAERGVTAAGKAELISGDQAQEINRRIHSRYMSSHGPAAHPWRSKPHFERRLIPNGLRRDFRRSFHGPAAHP
jgi:PPOX class probable F420-dependent enzyme